MLPVAYLIHVTLVFDADFAVWCSLLRIEAVWERQQPASVIGSVPQPAQPRDANFEARMSPHHYDESGLSFQTYSFETLVSEPELRDLGFPHLVLNQSYPILGVRSVEFLV